MPNTEKNGKPLKHSKPRTRGARTKAGQKNNIIYLQPGAYISRGVAETQKQFNARMDKLFGVHELIDKNLPFSLHLEECVSLMNASLRRIVIIAKAYGI